MGDINRFYEILEIQPGASLAEIKHAYRDLVFVWHPDRFAHNTRLQQKAQQRLTEINEAYEQLILFLSQPELSSIEPEWRQPSPAPVPETLNRRGFRKPASKGGSKKSKISPKASSNSKKQFSTVKSKSPKMANSARKSQKSPNPNFSSPKRFSTPHYSKPFANSPKRFSTPHSNFKTQHYSMFPIGPLAIAFGSYALTGCILAKSDAPQWMWALICGADWLWAAILVAEGSGTPEVWLAALVLAGAVGGAIAGNQAGGIATAVAWALVGAGLGAIATSEVEYQVVAGVLAVAVVLTVVGLMAGTYSGDWVKAVIEAVCWAMAGTICGLGAEVSVNSRNPGRFGGAMGLAIGATIGIFAGAGVDAIGQAFAQVGSNAVYGALAAIGVIAGFIARMVAGERTIGCTNGLYTFTLLTATSGLGLWLGNWSYITFLSWVRSVQ
ncbi:MAG: J domain-containing protein [Microcoleus sp. CSU_2_2]|nr:J domain-containing protein [Microcoleus sp. CSU_2_2]